MTVVASRTLFRIFYRLGFTPWDGHPLQPRLRELIEGSTTTPALTPGVALDLGCGTGDPPLSPAGPGGAVTGIAFVPAALAKARRKAAQRNVAVDFVHADVTQLTEAGLPGGYTLIVDTGCLHNLPTEQRLAYAREVTAVAAPDARLFLVGYPPNTQRGVLGITEAELRGLLEPDWSLMSTNDPHSIPAGEAPVRDFLFQKQPLHS